MVWETFIWSFNFAKVPRTGCDRRHLDVFDTLLEWKIQDFVIYLNCRAFCKKYNSRNLQYIYRSSWICAPSSFAAFHSCVKFTKCYSDVPIFLLQYQNNTIQNNRVHGNKFNSCNLILFFLSKKINPTLLNASEHKLNKKKPCLIQFWFKCRK